MDVAPRRRVISTNGLAVAAKNEWLALRRLARAWALLWEKPLVAAVMSFAAYSAITTTTRGSIFRTSISAYYNYLADAFLHGSLFLRTVPPHTHDLVHYSGHWSLYWGPFPAVALMPLVALFGVKLSDIFITLVVGACNVALVACVLRCACRREVLQLSAVQRGLIILCFALGTVQMTLVPFGSVWSLDQLSAFALVGLGYLAALRLEGRWAFFATGLAFAAVISTRNHMILAAISPATYLIVRYWSLGYRKLLSRLSLIALPVCVALGGLGTYNWLRFGSPLQMGIPYHQMNIAFVADYHHYGFMSLHYVPINVYYQYLAYPLPPHSDTLQGGSLFLLTPLFAFAIWGLIKQRRNWIAWALAASVIAVDIPILVLMGTGWTQFGPRYTLDFTMPLLLLTGFGIRRVPPIVVLLLTVVAIAQYVYGTLYLGFGMA